MPMIPSAATAHAQSHSHSHAGTPSPWVQRFAALVPEGDVLDLACGSGRHARLFAARGHAVLAVDRDGAALMHLGAQEGGTLTTLQLDLEDPVVVAAAIERGIWPLGSARFAAVVVTNYLHRPLLHALADSLVPGGLLIYETFAAGNERFGKPSNPDFLLQPGELLRLAREHEPALHVLAYEDLAVDSPAPAMVQRLCARRPGPE